MSSRFNILFYIGKIYESQSDTNWVVKCEKKILFYMMKLVLLPISYIKYMAVNLSWDKF